MRNRALAFCCLLLVATVRGGALTFQGAGPGWYLTLCESCYVQESPLVAGTLASWGFESSQVHSPIYVPSLEAAAGNASLLPTYVEDTPFGLPRDLLTVLLSGKDAYTKVRVDLGALSATQLNLLSSPPSGVAAQWTNQTLLDVWGPRDALNGWFPLALELIPALDANAPIPMTVTVSDDENPSVTHTVIFSGLAVNDVPRARDTLNASACEHGSYTLDLGEELDTLFVDPEGDAMTIESVTTQPFDDLYNAVTERIIWNNIGANYEGTYQFNITLRDAHGARAHHTLELSVYPLSHPLCADIEPPAAAEDSAAAKFIKDNAASIFGALGGAVSLALTILLICWVSARNRRKSLAFLEAYYEQRGHPPRAHELLMNLNARIKKRSGVDGGEALLLKLRRKGRITWEGSAQILPADDAFVELSTRHTQRLAVDQAIRSTLDTKQSRSFGSQRWHPVPLDGDDLLAVLAELPAIQALSLTDDDLEMAVTTLGKMELWAWPSDSAPDIPPGLWVAKAAAQPSQGRSTPSLSRPRLSQVVPIHSQSTVSGDEESGLLSDPPPPPYNDDELSKSGSEVSSLLLDE